MSFWKKSFIPSSAFLSADVSAYIQGLEDCDCIYRSVTVQTGIVLHGSHRVCVLVISARIACRLL